jgi:hypothetical protein
MDAIRLKQILGSPLAEHELMCLQIEQNGFGCGPCSTTGRSSDRPIDSPDAPRHGTHAPD